jgi:hypothetical protein
MTAKKFFGVALLISILAALVQVIDQLIQSSDCCPSLLISGTGFGWLAFQAWASYFITGGTIKGGLSALVAYIAGIVGSILIMVLGGWFAKVGIPGFWANPLSLLILVIPVIYLERAKVLIPILFVGAGAFFAIMTFQPTSPTTYLNAACTELLYCLVGLVFGWITVTLRVKYESCGKK